MILLFSSSNRSARDICAIRLCECIAGPLLAIEGCAEELGSEGLDDALLTARKPFGGPAGGGRDMIAVSSQ